MIDPVFIDTSGIYASLDAADPNHAIAAAIFRTLVDSGTSLRTHRYVVVETAALVQARLGMHAARALHDHIVALFDVRWVDEQLHRRAVSALVAADRRDVSLVDWVSFEMMRDEGIATAFTFDRHFADRGFGSATPPLS